MQALKATFIVCALGAVAFAALLGVTTAYSKNNVPAVNASKGEQQLKAQIRILSEPTR